jgi:AraC family transcriptional regulator
LAWQRLNKKSMQPYYGYQNSAPVPTVLRYGQFYGVFKYRYEINNFSLAVICADKAAVSGLHHTHEAAHMIFVVNGPYVLSAANRQRTLSDRSLIYVPGGTTHRNHPMPETRVLTISIAPWQIDQARDYAVLPDRELDIRNIETSFLARRLLAQCHDWTNASPLTAEGLCLELLGAIAKGREVSDARPPQWLRHAKELLHENCRTSVRIGELAAAVGVHPIHLSRTFRKFFRVTPGEYLRNLRLEVAASMLRKRDGSVAFVALESGFSDQSQLSRVFRRKFGVTPAEYRREHFTRV